MAMTRPPRVNDDGTGTTGTIVDAAWVDTFCDGIDAADALLLPLAGGALTGPISGPIRSSHATSGIGYATGAGGSVNQATSKATGVTVNKATGEITMHGAALAADTTVSFTLTSSAIAATDLLIINHRAVGTAGAYTFTSQCAAGSAVIYVRNVTAGSLSEAISIVFAVIKSVLT